MSCELTKKESRIIILLSFIFISLTTGCYKNKSRESIAVNQKLHSEVIGKILKFDSSIVKIKGNKDFKIQKYKFITFLDSECNSCIQILINWDDYCKKNKSRFIAFFLIQGNETELFKRYIYNNSNADFTFYRDKDSMFLLNNSLSAYFQKTLVLDEKNQIKYVGSPVGQESIEIQKDIDEIFSSHD